MNTLTSSFYQVINILGLKPTLHIKESFCIIINKMGHIKISKS